MTDVHRGGGVYAGMTGVATVCYGTNGIRAAIDFTPRGEKNTQEVEALGLSMVAGGTPAGAVAARVGSAEGGRRQEPPAGWRRNRGDGGVVSEAAEGRRAGGGAPHQRQKGASTTSGMGQADAMGADGGRRMCRMRGGGEHDAEGSEAGTGPDRGGEATGGTRNDGGGMTLAEAIRIAVESGMCDTDEAVGALVRATVEAEEGHAGEGGGALMRGLRRRLKAAGLAEGTHYDADRLRAAVEMAAAMRAWTREGAVGSGGGGAEQEVWWPGDTVRFTQQGRAKRPWLVGETGTLRRPAMRTDWTVEARGRMGVVTIDVAPGDLALHATRTLTEGDAVVATRAWRVSAEGEAMEVDGGAVRLERRALQETGGGE